MRILIISTNLFICPPPAYSGLEMVAYCVADQMRKRGHEVAVVAPEGSRFPDGIRHIRTILGEPEENVWKGNTEFQKAIMEEGYDIIWDNSWQSFAYMGSKGRDPSLPLLHTFHADPRVWGTPPPWVRYPGAIGLSEAHADQIRSGLGIPAKVASNGVDTTFYTLNPAVKRSNRYLFLGRYDPVKGPLEAIQMCKEEKVNLTLVGDIVFPPDKAYIKRCFEAADGLWIRALPAVTREETVAYYQSHKALLCCPNWAEPFGLNVIEAGLCGMPVIIKDYPGSSSRELVKHGETGFVCKTIDEMKDVIARDLVKEIDPQKCREWAMQFSVEAMGARYESLFAQFKDTPW